MIHLPKSNPTTENFVQFYEGSKNPEVRNAINAVSFPYSLLCGYLADMIAPLAPKTFTPATVTKDYLSRETDNALIKAGTVLSDLRTPETRTALTQATSRNVWSRFTSRIHFNQVAKQYTSHDASLQHSKFMADITATFMRLRIDALLLQLDPEQAINPNMQRNLRDTATWIYKDAQNLHKELQQQAVRSNFATVAASELGYNIKVMEHCAEQADIIQQFLEMALELEEKPIATNDHQRARAMHDRARKMRVSAVGVSLLHELRNPQHFVLRHIAERVAISLNRYQSPELAKSAEAHGHTPASLIVNQAKDMCLMRQYELQGKTAEIKRIQQSAYFVTGLQAILDQLGFVIRQGMPQPNQSNCDASLADFHIADASFAGHAVDFMTVPEIEDIVKRHPMPMLHAEKTPRPAPAIT